VVLQVCLPGVAVTVYRVMAAAPALAGATQETTAALSRGLAVRVRGADGTPVVIRPTWSPSYWANHMSPSAPGAIPTGPLYAVIPVPNSVTFPVGVIRPI
jgi:hypothetical protein